MICSSKMAQEGGASVSKQAKGSGALASRSSASGDTTSGFPAVGAMGVPGTSGNVVQLPNKRSVHGA